MTTDRRARPGLAVGWWAPRCGAWARTSGQPCRHAVVKGRNRCYWHGGRNHGPPAGNKNAMTHGKTTATAITAKREAAAAAKAAVAKVQEAVKAADAALAAAGKPQRRRKVKPIPG